MFKRTPLAWLQLRREKTRLAVALAGIAFADLLMFMQLGFLGALFTSNTALHRSFEADLVIAHAQYETLFSIQSIPRDRIYQALFVPEVAAVSAVSLSTASWRNPEALTGRTILVFGVSPARPGFRASVLPEAEALKLPERVLFDRASRPEYGPIAARFAAGQPVRTELNRTRVEVAGLVGIGPSFVADGNVITSETTFLRIFNDRSPEKIELGLLRLVPGADPLAVQSQLAARLPEDVQVLTPERFAGREADYWANSTGIGFIFGLGVAVGFIVGVVIVYQILYADVADHLAEYATLKAMGYPDAYLWGVLLQESLILSVLGFIPGIIVTLALYALAYEATLLPITMPSERLALVFGLTVLMCAGSALIASRKLSSADPADIF
ncbi:ABC transporter permease DevC [Gloeobacter morelensis]|uniref:FtsX-like permease family protein n=1 Tax=Gloeobacter morelensis MG652769 TaxID=2781736 RepID=A0ABY3PP00_9CYAN|nr:ABC transporter permease DevC [Gloeobacter morelensis]UFP95137.1 FtsX-like permease family protein [Gloeobacter morelensis MG652769]